ncbi:ephrin type-A receptor 4a-like [Anoplophora glabripennis]|uniref:ephrin type-A receptor 4a-like n=1 Tax=Anoplophora glabripennis TaxID=217634 RepID=UPI00087542A6|nr:ephrin type-A receptor 4a-like [Anoplophora glabripennis]
MPPKNNRRRRTRKRCHRKQVTSTMPPSDNLEIESLMRSFEGALDLQTDLDCFTVDKGRVNDEFYILGEGSFGLVTLGTLRKPDGCVAKVALKGANNSKFVKMMKEEAKVMTNFDHDNVVKFFGVQETPFKIIMEYMQHGDLLDALRKNVFPNITDLIDVLIQVTSGMEYISYMKYIHRDLACRNVFVNSKKQCKIGDFGLCKYVGDTGGIYNMNGKQFFNQYCAPEVMDTKKFTTKCDVWSMGLLIWELYISVSNEVPGFYKQIILDFFTLTGKLAQPKLCPPDLYNYAKDVLLNGDPNKRPVFSEIKTYLCDMNRNLPPCQLF